MPIYADRVKVSTASTGVGDIVLGPALPGFRTFADAGITSFEAVHYVIEDGDAWETGWGQLKDNSGMSRSAYASSDGGAKINLSGDAQVSLALLAQDMDDLAEEITKTVKGRWTVYRGSSEYHLNGFTNFGGRYIADTLAGEMTLAAPSGPANGNEIWFMDPNGGWGPNPLTVDGNGKNIEGSPTFSADVAGGNFILIYDTDEWKVRFAGGQA